MRPYSGLLNDSVCIVTFRACLATGKESIVLMILYYHWNKDFSMENCIVEDFTLILVCIMHIVGKNRVWCANPLK